MSAPRCRDTDHIDFLIAAPRIATCTEAARVQPDRCDAPAHDAFPRLLTRLEPEPDVLWEGARPRIAPRDGALVPDDSALDEPHAKRIGLVGWLWSGKHRRAVAGIDLISPAWTDGDRVIPCDYRLHDKADGKAKNDHFRDPVAPAAARGLAPRTSRSTCGTRAWRTSRRSTARAGPG